jgi:16S rRNA C1402 (ribose-2'-O) methylase RsmI
VEHFKSQPARGEFTLVVEGKPKDAHEKWTEGQLVEAIMQQLQNEKSAKQISNELAETSGWNKKDIYALVNLSK